jgi:hypothetical protein
MAWLGLNYYTLQAMTERNFESEASMRMRKPVFYISSYSYVVLACLLAWIFRLSWSLVIQAVQERRCGDICSASSENA